MPWTRFRDPATGKARVARVSGNAAVQTDHHDLLEAIEASATFDAVARESSTLETLDLISLIDAPPSIRDFMAFEQHVVTSALARGLSMDADWYNLPVFYFSNPAAVVGPRAEIAIPPGSAEFDFELEVAVVVAKDGSDIPIEDAEEYIAGYMLMCDWSARDVQMREMRQSLGPSKGKDSATSFGHLFVTREEMEQYRSGSRFDIPLTAYVNDVLYSSGNLGEVYWTFAEMISHASVGTRVRRGDVIGSGTVGTGCIFELSAVHGRERYPYLQSGDHVRLDGGPLGSIEAYIRGSAGSPVFTADRAALRRAAAPAAASPTTEIEVGP
jgi:2-keto-4-pentenoate hydratase/2-oxohepta-3-ene-1,7-dioic acid hydratase in catechol pathway